MENFKKSFQIIFFYSLIYLHHIRSDIKIRNEYRQHIMFKTFKTYNICEQIKIYR